MKATQASTDDAAATCECVPCRVRRAGLPAGPYTPSQFAVSAPSVIAPSNGTGVAYDPKVIAAEQRRTEARAAFDAADALWIESVAAHRSAELLADPFVRDEDGEPIAHRNPSVKHPELVRLEEAQREARKRRERAWEVVVKANDEIREAQFRARMAVVEAARNGQNGTSKGRR